jgi:DNA-binding NarL/FixJ family response regulator
VSVRIRVLLVDDHEMVRQVLAERLAREPDLEVVGLLATADQVVAESIRLRPHVVVFDIDMPGVTCFEAARGLRESCPETRALFLSAFCHDAYVAQALAVGARGYLTKGEPPQVLIEALRAVFAGRTRYSREVQNRIVVDAAGAHLGPKTQSRASTLTPRELDVLRYIARGLAQKDMATAMHLSAKTVHCHCVSLMRKLDIHDRVELARFAIREGLVQA